MTVNNVTGLPAFNLSGTGPGMFTPQFNLGLPPNPLSLSPDLAAAVSPLGLAPLSVSPWLSGAAGATGATGGGFAPFTLMPGGAGGLTPSFGEPSALFPTGAPQLAPGAGLGGFTGALQSMGLSSGDVTNIVSRFGAPLLRQVLGAPRQSAESLPEYPEDVTLGGGGTPGGGAGVAGAQPPPAATPFSPEEYEREARRRMLAAMRGPQYGAVSPYGQGGPLPVPSPYGTY
jgi:hypothetical protein